MSRDIKGMGVEHKQKKPATIFLDDNEEEYWLAKQALKCFQKVATEF